MTAVKTLSAAAVASFAAIAAVPGVAAADDHKASVYVLHAVPGATVDVFVNGNELLSDFTPGTLTDAQMLEEGEYDLKVVAPDAGADGEAIIEANDVKVPAGANVTVVAHLDADGNPTLTPFVNDMSKVAAGEGRLTVRHVAGAPTTDVRANGEVAFSGLNSGKEAKADLAAGTIKADVVLAGTDTVAIGPADVTVAEGKNTIVYAWGSAADSNLDLAVQTLDGLHSAPHGVPAGNGGQAADAGVSAAGLAAAAGVLVAGGVVFMRRRAAAN